MGRRASKENRQVIAELTQKIGFVDIKKVLGGYDISINFEVVKSYKKRSSCNNYLKRLNNEKSKKK